MEGVEQESDESIILLFVVRKCTENPWKFHRLLELPGISLMEKPETQF